MSEVFSRCKERGSYMEHTGKPNRLINESSPYLQQHAYNPVDWYPWGPEALERSRREGKPILLSVGYSTCHWCHVMAHECFENPAIAQLMNDLFISIKVDREERPDMDEIYMNAVQMMTGRGGWPMTVFLTPDGKPFYGGTYFPPEDRGLCRDFRGLLQACPSSYENVEERILKRCWRNSCSSSTHGARLGRERQTNFAGHLR